MELEQREGRLVAMVQEQQLRLTKIEESLATKLKDREVALKTVRNKLKEARLSEQVHLG